MGFDNNMNKFQDISNLLAKAKYPQDVLNSKEIDIKSDFQYICLNSAINYDIVIQIIARLAQNGNKAIVEENINLISMNLWKDLFNQNEFTKKIFINNFDLIYRNTNVMSYTEVENFLNDKDACNIIYAYLDEIIIKLTTQDRASLISLLNEKQNGANIIKQNLHNFFKKGTFGISTTYSRVLAELDNIEGIEKIDILRACSNSFSSMLNRATAFDNETNKMLNWLYDAIEETKMDETERKYLKDKIERAVYKNFNGILEKTNYNKDTIKILKQFDCIRAAFSENKNDYIQMTSALNDEYDVETNRKAIEQIPIMDKQNSVSTSQNGDDEGSKIQDFDIQPQSPKNNNTLNNENDMGQTKRYELSNELINSYIKRYSNKNSPNNQNVQKEEQNELQEKLQKLIYSNIHETDRIINKVLNKEDSDVTKEASKESTEVTNVQMVNNTIQPSNIAKENVNYEKNENKFEYNDTSKQSTANQTALTLANPEAKKFLKKGFFKKIVKRVLKIFGYQKGTERIGE